MKFKSKPKNNVARLSDRVLLLGLVLALVYWVISSLIYALTTADKTFVVSLFKPDVNETLSRLLVLCFFMIFGSHVGFTIRQRQMADNALAGSEEKHRTIIENIEDGYFEIDRDHTFVLFNDSFRKITGYTAQQLRQLDYRRLLTPAETKQVIDAFDQVNRTGKAIKDLRFVIVRKDGDRRWVETSVSRMIGREGESNGFRGILRDVTRRLQAEALEQEKTAAESASRSKSEFLANMSHEIRTPLNAIIGLVELLLESSMTREQREDLKVVKSAAYALLSVINDILDFSKIEAGKLELDRSGFNLRDFLGETLKILAVSAHEKNLELTYRVATDVPDRLVGDPHRFRQVLLNLVGNAVKFTESGEIVVSATCASITTDPLILAVAVRDTGVGIPVGRQAQIFEAFNQADSSNPRYGGTGLGLTVSAQLVNLMGGKITVDSEMGKGSTFHFSIACDVESEKRPWRKPPGDIDLSGLQALVVDDNATNLEILCEMLASWKIKPEPADSSVAGINQFSEMARGTAGVDLALIDADLPQSGALSLVGRIRGDAEATTRIIMMLTTTTKATDRFAAKGVSAMVTKPVRPSDLLDAIVTSLSLKTPLIDSTMEKAEVSGVVSLPSLNILVAEDTPFNRKYIRRLLESWHCQATIVDNGRRALERLADQHFDLVLMDVQMPELDGLTATARIREQEKMTQGHLPIIAMTAHAMRGDRKRCIEAGMDDYVSKPISAARLMEAIYRVVPMADSRRESAAANPSSTADGVEDMAALLDAFNNDSTFFKDVADMFLSDYPPMLESLKQAIADEDGERLSRTAHSLKGMARNFQIDAAADAARQLERLAGHGQFAAARNMFHTLADELVGFDRRLRQMVARISER